MSMANTMNLVCINLKAKPKEALCAATLNSAGKKKIYNKIKNKIKINNIINK